MTLYRFVATLKRCSLLAAMAGMVLIWQAGLPASASAQTAGSAAAQSKAAKSAASKKASSAKMDINSVSADTLKTLPGITDAVAQKIIAGRPYRTKAQLVSKGIVPKDTYEKISSMIIARQSTAGAKAAQPASASSK